MEKEDKISLIKTAIEAEKETLRVYIKSAIKVSNVSGKNMFLKLALDEMGHREFLEKELDRELSTCPFTVSEIDKKEIPKIIPDVEKELDKTRHLGQDDLIILMLAQQVEKSGMDYYKRCLEDFQDPEAKEIFSKLLTMEEEHYNLIQTQIDYIEGTGYWLGIREFTLDD